MAKPELMYTIHLSTERRSNEELVVIPFEEGNETQFNIISHGETIGVLHKTNDLIWEWVGGNVTFIGAKEIGDRIDCKRE